MDRIVGGTMPAITREAAITMRLPKGSQAFELSSKGRTNSSRIARLGRMKTPIHC